MLSIYRRHNPAKCSSKDTQHCTNKRYPCPIWIRGSKPDGNEIRESLKSRDWTKATEIMREIEATGLKPAPVKAVRGVSIEDWRDQFVKNARTEGVSDETLRKYTQLFKQLLAFANDKGIQSPAGLDLEKLQEFRNTWKDRSLSKSKKQERLRSICKFALARKWISENPAIQLGRIKVERTQQVPFNADEMTAILKAAKKAGAEVYTFVLTMRFSGLRISDVTMLRVDSLVGNHLVLRTEKTGTPVKVLLPEVVADALRKIKTKGSDYFFWDGKTKLVSVTDLWRSRRLKPIFAVAKVKNGHPHRFRHTFAVELLKQGTRAATVAILLGNTDQIVVKHYSAWVKERQQGLDDAVTKANGYHDIEPV